MANFTTLITGPPGVGKTTLVRKVYTSLQQDAKIKCQGFYTVEVRANINRGPRIGFDVITLDGKRGILAREQQTHDKQQLHPKVGKYDVYVCDFEELALPQLTKQHPDDNQPMLMIIDEIGKMELMSKRFERAISTLTQTQQQLPLLATIPSQTCQPIEIVERLKAMPACRIFKMSKTNRDELAVEILAYIKMQLIK